MPAFLIEASDHVPIFTPKIWVGLQVGSFSIGSPCLFISMQICRRVERLVGICGFLAFFDNAKLLLMSLSARHDIFLR
uniref:Uncharacterized protein n=1 Tax=Rhizobium leguminosarum TaxID=384 RepID=A0A179B9J2_RHILE|nr:hypothetical protein A4U53_35205 [Rhizobium leguminosarum]